MCSTMKPRFAASAMMSPSLAGRLHRRLAGSRFDSKDAVGCRRPRAPVRLLTRWRRVLAHAENGALRIANLCVTRPHGVVGGQHECIEVLSRRC
jgi:hypothetical protein